MKPALSSFLAFVLGCLAGTAPAQPAVVPLTRAHAHNDYEHKRPLLDALDHGLCSVEADIHLADGQLLVAHDRRNIQPGRTLQALYLDPLRMRIRQNGGRVYPNGPECTLLIDIKGDWATTYPVLREVLKQYTDILTTFQDGKKQTRALLAIITGDRSRTMFDGETIRYAALDGDLDDLNSTAPADVIPWISAPWYRSFKWRGGDSFPEPERFKLRDLVDRAHRHGRKVRFWGAPDKPAFWSELLANGVDLINTDDLDGVQKFLLKTGKP